MHNLMKIAGICFLVVIAIGIAILVFDVTPGNLLFAAAVLLCPLLHVFMMRSGNHTHGK